MRVTVSVPDEIDHKVRQLAEEEGVSVSAFYARAVEEHVRERRRQKAISAVRELIGNADISSNFDEELRRMREDDPHR